MPANCDDCGTPSALNLPWTAREKAQLVTQKLNNLQDVLGDIAALRHYTELSKANSASDIDEQET